MPVVRVQASTQACQTIEFSLSIRFCVILCRRLGSRNDLSSVIFFLVDPMVGYWCRVGSQALKHTRNDVAILVQRRTLLRILLFSFLFSSLNVVRVCCF